MLTRQVNSYRVEFFERARRDLAAEGVEFVLLVGGETAEDRAKLDPAELPWAEQVGGRSLPRRSADIAYHPILARARSSDLVIVEQATKQLVNIPLAILQRRNRVRHCLWGHGRNFQGSFDGERGEPLKRWFTRPAHWFFSYTALSTDAVIELGFPQDRVTTLQNSTDVEAVRDRRREIDPDELASLRRRLGLRPGPVIGFVGGLYPPKRPDFLVDSLDEAHALEPTLDAVIVGDGSDADLIRDRASSRSWLHHLGSIYGAERVAVLALCDLLVMPGMVGLNVVDGFALGLPTVTTAIGYHSPEIAYLEHGVNGWICPAEATPTEFASTVVGLVRDRGRLAILSAGANATGDRLGVTPMAERFVTGVGDALAAPPRFGSGRD